MSTDNHDKMIEAFQSYFKWQDRFEFHDSDEAGIKVPQKKKLNSGTTRWMKDFIWYLSVAIGASFFLVLANYAFAGGNTTTIKYQGQPVPSAMAPSMSAFSQDESPTKSNN